MHMIRYGNEKQKFFWWKQQCNDTYFYKPHKKHFAEKKTYLEKIDVFKMNKKNK